MMDELTFRNVLRIFLGAAFLGVPTLLLSQFVDIHGPWPFVVGGIIGVCNVGFVIWLVEVFDLDADK